MKASQPMFARRRARELAVQVLYAMDNRPGQNVDLCLSAFLAEDGEAFGDTPEVKEYLSLLAKGAWRRRAEADGLMLRLVTGWRPERMVSVDRAVLRLSIFEGFLEKMVPPAVAISEAIELARLFGTDESGRFVNGVLARVADHVETEGKKNNATGDTQVSTDS